MLHRYLNAVSFYPVQRVGFVYVRAAQFKAFRMQDFRQRAHAGAANPDKMNALDVIQKLISIQTNTSNPNIVHFIIVRSRRKINSFFIFRQTFALLLQAKRKNGKILYRCVKIQGTPRLFFRIRDAIIKVTCVRIRNA